MEAPNPPSGEQKTPPPPEGEQRRKARKMPTHPERPGRARRRGSRPYPTPRGASAPQSL